VGAPHLQAVARVEEQRDGAGAQARPKLAQRAADLLRPEVLPLDDDEADPLQPLGDRAGVVDRVLERAPLIVGIADDERDPLVSAQALVIGGFHVVGNANNVNYGEEAIRSSLRRLDDVGIPYTGAGLNRQVARAPAIVTHEGLRFGFLQRTSVYWATGHEATDHSPGVAV